MNTLRHIPHVRHTIRWYHPALLLLFAMLAASCLGSKISSSQGGEVTGHSGRTFAEPTPYGMTLVKRGHVKMGIEQQDSLWGRRTPVRDISVESFWMY